jgi:hypothetical protein
MDVQTTHNTHEIVDRANDVLCCVKNFAATGEALVEAVNELAPLLPCLNPEFAYSFKVILGEMIAAGHMLVADGKGHAARLRVRVEAEAA